MSYCGQLYESLRHDNMIKGMDGHEMILLFFIVMVSNKETAWFYTTQYVFTIIMDESQQARRA